MHEGTPTDAVFSAPGPHQHWGWHCPKPLGCGYQSPLYSPTEDAARQRYAAHLTHCTARHPAAT